MQRLLSFLPAFCLIMTLAACGNIFIRGAFPGDLSSVRGSVGVVQLSAVMGENGTTVQVTFVTFLQDSAATTIGFCGDQREHFQMQQTVLADFRPGHPCASIVTIVIL